MEKKKWTIEFPAFSEKQIKLYSEIFDIDPCTLQVNGEFYVPGHFIIGFFRSKKILEPLYKEGFPLQSIDSFYGNHTSTYENRLFLNEPLVFHFEKYADPEVNKFLFSVKIVRKKNNPLKPRIVLEGLFKFVGN